MNRVRLVAWSVVLCICVTFASRTAEASYAFYIGKNLTADGSVMIGGTGEEVSSHWLDIVPRRSWEPDAAVEVGVTPEANIPGELIEIPQVPTTYRYITMNYTDFKGFPPPLTNGGINEHHLAVRDVWATSRKELIEMTPTPQKGVNYSDIARLVMERATTAREAVEIAGALIDEHGFATYGGNSHLFADPDEGWVMIEYAGGEGLWVAERLGPDDVRVSYPGYVGEVPADYKTRDDFMGSDNLIDFAVEKGWYDPDSGEPFNAHLAYGPQGQPMRNPGLKYVSQETLENDVRDAAPVTLEEMIGFVRDYRIADDEAGYGQVAHLRPGIRSELATLWVAPTGSITAPFIPYRLGVQEVAPEYRQHRYLTRNSGSTFLHPDFGAQEATQFAGRLFKRLLYYTCEHPDRFLPEVTEALTAFEKRLLDEQPEVETTARVLYDKDPELAERYLTEYSRTQAERALELGEALVGSIEARTKLLYGIREPRGSEINTPTHDTMDCRTEDVTERTQAAANLPDEKDEEKEEPERTEPSSQKDDESQSRDQLPPWVWGMLGFLVGAVAIGIVSRGR